MVKPHRHIAHRAAHQHQHQHQRRAFWDDIEDAWDDLIGKNDDDEKKGNGPKKESESETPTRIVVTKTTHETTTRPTITATGKAAEKSTLVLEKSTSSTKRHTTTHAIGTPIRATGTPSAIMPTLKSSDAIDSTLAIAPTTSVTKDIDRANAATSTTPSSANPSAVASTSEGGTSAGAKAGIAIGVLAGLLALFVLVWFLFTKKKRQVEKQRLEDDEKINGPFSDNAAIRTPATAPRLSLRPVTQFIPNLMSGSEKRSSQAAGAMLNPASAQASPLNRPAGASAWERPTANSLNNGSPFDRQTASPSPNLANPFNDSQRILEGSRPVSPLDKELPTPNVAPAQPVSPVESSDTLPEFPGPSAAGAVAGGVAAGAIAGAAAAGASAGLVRKASMRKDVPKPLDLTRPPPLGLGVVPPSPAGTEFSVNSVAPGQSPGPSASAAVIAAAGGPVQSTVHRVQLDFKATLEDELDLNAGQLVRLLHEYDDGWALCIRLDRSRQGVVPRTCLSVRPVKPRPPQGGGPRGPPVNPNRGPNYPPSNRGMNPRGPPPNGQYPRPGSANGQYGRPGSANSQYPRPGSAAGGPRPGSAAGGQYPRPGSAAGRPMGPPGGRGMSPGPRSQSPGPNPHGRSQSPQAMNRRMTPPGPSGMSQEFRPAAQGNPQGPPTTLPERKPVPGQAY